MPAFLCLFPICLLLSVFLIVGTVFSSVIQLITSSSFSPCWSQVTFPTKPCPQQAPCHGSKALCVMPITHVSVIPPQENPQAWSATSMIPCKFPVVTCIFTHASTPVVIPIKLVNQVLTNCLSESFYSISLMSRFFMFSEYHDFFRMPRKSSCTVKMTRVWVGLKS